jgi:AP-2 complex subunit alpha
VDYNDIIVILQVLQRILMGTDVVKNVNKNNASHAVLFEALALVSLYLCFAKLQFGILSF